jgi:hypothetical protein
MSKRIPARPGRRFATGGPAGRGPTRDAMRGSTAAGRLQLPMRRLRQSRPPDKGDSSGPRWGPPLPGEE